MKYEGRVRGEFSGCTESTENEGVHRQPWRKVEDGIEQPGGSRGVVSREKGRGGRGLFEGINEGKNRVFNCLD